MATATYECQFGDLDFSPAAQVGDAEWRLYGLVRGKQVPVTQVVDSMLRNGAMEEIDHWENVDHQLLLGLKWPDSAARASAERELQRECLKGRNTFSWTPPDGYGAVTVFDVEWATADFDDSGDWDLGELRGLSTWILTLRCRPFGRTETEVVVDALNAGASPSTTVISDGTSATGWTSPYGTVTVVSGELDLPLGAGTQKVVWPLFVTGYPYEATVTIAATDFTTTPYVFFDVDTGGVANESVTAPPSVHVDGVELPRISSQALSATKFRYTFLCADPSATTVLIRGVAYVTSPSRLPLPSAAVRIDNVTRTNQPPGASSTGRQSVRSATILGSAPTEGRFEVSHETSALGDVILHSAPQLSAGSSPAKRQWRVSGANTPATQANALSGFDETLGTSEATATVFNVPASSLLRGTHSIYVRVASSSGTDADRIVSVSAATLVGSTPLGEDTIASLPFPALSSLQIVPVGELTLPPLDVPETSAAVVQFKVWASGANMKFDDLLVFFAGPGSALTLVHAGSGSPSLGAQQNRLWLDPASTARPTPAVWLGTQADRSDAFYADIDDIVEGWGTHPLTPGDNVFYLATTGAANAEMPISYFPRVFGHVANSDLS